MQSTLALNIPQTSPVRSAYRVALIDIFAGLLAVDIWGRLGWRDNKRRYRRTLFGPFWTTASLALFVIALGLVWSNLWHQNPRTYLPYLTSGMLCWTLFSVSCTEGCTGFIGQETLIKQLRISFTLLACATLWRNIIVFFHNIVIYVLICVYGGVSITWATLLVIPGFALLCVNNLWIAMLLGAVCARYRDIAQLISNVLQISLFLTPIFWSPDQLTGRAALLADLNPLYHLVAIVREPLLGRWPEPLTWMVVVTSTLVGWALTIHVMSKFRHRIVYWL
jgi:ABC-type polysaccharide/polyol phosphate export permease